MNPKLMYPVKFPRCFMIWKQIIQFWITVSYTRYEIVTVTRKIVRNDALKSKPFAIKVSVVTGFSPFKKENNKKNRKKHVHDVQDWLSYKYEWKYLKFYYTQVYSLLRDMYLIISDTIKNYGAIQNI